MTSSDTLLPATSEPATPALPPELRDVAEYVAASLSPATRRAYECGWKDFSRWCDAAGVESLPATAITVARYIAALAKAGRSVSTIQQRCSAIRYAHEVNDLEAATAAKGVRETLAGIRRELGVAPRRKAPATPDRLRAIASHVPRDTLQGIRDRALLLFGFASACRRSELAALDLDDLEETEDGLLVTVRRSKTDQEGAGHERGVPFGRSAETCPVEALSAWISAAGLTCGPVFRRIDRHGNVGASLTPRAIGDVVKLYAARAGFEPADYAGHSLRAGFITDCGARGVSHDRIMDHTGHRSYAMIRTYTRRADVFADHPLEGVL